MIAQAKLKGGSKDWVRVLRTARTVRCASRQRDVNEQRSIVGGREDGGLSSRVLQPKREELSGGFPRGLIMERKESSSDYKRPRNVNYPARC